MAQDLTHSHGDWFQIATTTTYLFCISSIGMYFTKPERTTILGPLHLPYQSLTYTMSLHLDAFQLFNKPNSEVDHGWVRWCGNRDLLLFVLFSICFSFGSFLGLFGGCFGFLFLFGQFFSLSLSGVWCSFSLWFWGGRLFSFFCWFLFSLISLGMSIS